MFPQIESSQHSVKEETEEQNEEPKTDIEKNDSVLRFSGTSESECSDNRPLVSNHTNKVTQKRRNSKIDDNVRQLIIRYLNNGMTPKDVAEMFGQKPDTIRHIYRMYTKTGLEKKSSIRGHRKQKLTEVQKRQLCVWVDQNCTLSLKELKTICMEKWPELGPISLMTIDRALQAFHFSFKRISMVPESKNSPEVIDKRYEYAVEYTRLKSDNKKFYFIDEYGIQVCSRASGGRALKGQRALKEVKRIRTRNYSVCAVMATDSLYLYQIQDRPYNEEHYLDFINQLCDYLACRWNNRCIPSHG